MRHMYDIPKSVVERIINLKSSYNTHLEVVRQLLEADNRRLFGVDLVVIGVMHRSIALIGGFTSMVEERNVLCANALLRLQVDSVLRLYACWLVGDPHSLIQPLLEGKPLDRVKSRDGKPLSDRYLRAEVSKLYPRVNSVYEQTSGFIHLSMPHMVAPVVGIDNSSHSLLMSIGKQGRQWTEKEMIEAVDAFIEATECVIHLAVLWLATKKTVAAERDVQGA